MPLTDEIVDQAAPGSKMFRLYDVRGLYLEVSPAGGKWWRLKFRYCGKDNRMSLGIYPQVTLTEARERRDAKRALLADGRNPVEQSRSSKAMRLAQQARLAAARRFTLDEDGALVFLLGKRSMNLTPAETAELRAFLDSTRSAAPEAPPCP